MAADEPSGNRPGGPVVLRIKLRYDDVATMVQRFAPNVGKSGLFLPTRALQPVGAEIKFELRLAAGQPVLIGLGRVRHTRAPDPAQPKKVYGMAIELTRVTRDSRDLILRMLARRRELRLASVAIPMPDDVEAARRAEVSGSGPREPASGPVPVPVPGPGSGSGPVSGPMPLVVGESQPEMLTAPRRVSGAVAVVKVADIAPLAPEPARRRRPAIEELIEQASSGVVPAVDLDLGEPDVDVSAVLARARVLAGGDLDDELDALREAQAAPIEITVEAASAEIARQLGGVAVRRWAPPPAVRAAEAPAVEAPAVEPAAEAVPAAAEAVPEPVEAAPEPVEAAPEPVAVVPEPVAVVPEPVEAAPEPVEAVPEVIEAEPVEAVREPVEAVAAPDAPVPVDDAPPPAAAEVHEVEPDQIHDEIHQLSEADFEEIEPTAVGEPVDPAAFDPHAIVAAPSANDEAALAARLDSHLAEAEHDDFGFGEPQALPPEYQRDFVHRFDTAPSEPAFVHDAYDDVVDPAAVRDEVQEVEDFEILAEVDDPESLAAQVGADPASDQIDRPSLSDFASRLDLDDRNARGYRDERAAAVEPLAPQLAASAGQALAALADAEESWDSFDERRPDGVRYASYDDGSSFTLSDTPAPAPALDFGDRSPALPPLGDDGDVELDSALRALDVDLDDLSLPRRPEPAPRRGRAPSRPRPIRATTDDGVVIDFEDDDD